MDEQPKFEWISFPFADFPIKTIFLIMFTFFIWTIVYSIWNDKFLLILSIFFMTVPLVPYYVPTRYRFYKDRIAVKIAFLERSRKYTAFHCFYADKMGVMLGTFRSPRRLDRFRGQSVRFSKNQEERETVLKFLEEKIGTRY